MRKHLENISKTSKGRTPIATKGGREFQATLQSLSWLLLARHYFLTRCHLLTTNIIELSATQHAKAFQKHPKGEHRLRLKAEESSRPPCNQYHNCCQQDILLGVILFSHATISSPHTLSDSPPHSMRKHPKKYPKGEYQFRLRRAKESSRSPGK